MTTSVDITDLVNLAVRLDGVGPRARAQLVTAVRKTAADVERRGKELAAVRTGAMRASIGTDVEVGTNYVQASVGPTVRYAPFVEYGTIWMAPQPFMGPALEQNEYKLEMAVASITGRLL